MVPSMPSEVALPPHVPIEAARGLKAYWANIRLRTARTFSPFHLHDTHFRKRGYRRSENVKQAVVDRRAHAPAANGGCSSRRSPIAVRHGFVT